MLGSQPSVPAADRQSSHVCSDCRARSPVTETPHTLISAQHGWRLTRTMDEHDRVVLEWRCPKCWLRYKERRELSHTPLDGVPSSRSRGITVDEPPPSASRSRK